LSFDSACAFLIQGDILGMVSRASVEAKLVMLLLVVFSVASWAVILSKWSLFRKASQSNLHFRRAFRKAPSLEAVALAGEQFPNAPLMAVFGFGYEEVERQVKARGTLSNKLSIERSLQLGMSEELAKLERHMNWLATTAAVSPFIGLFGTVLGIIRSFQGLSQAGSASLRAVAPGMAEALIATALGLAAAIPAAIFYNHYGHVIREIAARMEDFSLEFMNAAERSFGG
jgi:biopolymer transport protein TolQ